jgi:5-methylcytosine-specific restriction endonuclease McrA
MPRHALSVCPTSGCPELTTGGRCAACRSRAEKLRGSGGARGSTRKWQAFSKAYIARHPACRCAADWCGHDAGQCTGTSTDVDHVDGTGRNGPRAYDPTNLVALCHPCHSRKTAHMDGSFGR